MRCRVYSGKTFASLWGFTLLVCPVMRISEGEQPKRAVQAARMTRTPRLEELQPQPSLPATAIPCSSPTTTAATLISLPIDALTLVLASERHTCSVFGRRILREGRESRLEHARSRRALRDQALVGVLWSSKVANRHPETLPADGGRWLWSFLFLLSRAKKIAPKTGAACGARRRGSRRRRSG